MSCGRGCGNAPAEPTDIKLLNQTVQRSRCGWAVSTIKEKRAESASDVFVVARRAAELAEGGVKRRCCRGAFGRGNCQRCVAI